MTDIGDAREPSVLTFYGDPDPDRVVRLAAPSKVFYLDPDTGELRDPPAHHRPFLDALLAAVARPGEVITAADVRATRSPLPDPPPEPTRAEVMDRALAARRNRHTGPAVPPPGARRRNR